MLLAVSSSNWIKSNLASLRILHHIVDQTLFPIKDFCIKRGSRRRQTPTCTFQSSVQITDKSTRVTIATAAPLDLSWKLGFVAAPTDKFRIKFDPLINRILYQRQDFLMGKYITFLCQTNESNAYGVAKLFIVPI